MKKFILLLMAVMLVSACIAHADWQHVKKFTFYHPDYRTPGIYDEYTQQITGSAQDGYRVVMTKTGRRGSLINSRFFPIASKVKDSGGNVEYDLVRE